MLAALLILLALCPDHSTGNVLGVTSTSKLAHSTILDPENKYFIAWDFDDQFIMFEVSVETRGYIGLGFSPNGDMPGSDIVIGWVDDSTGMGHVSDRHAVGRSEPLVDDNQDYTLLHSYQNDTHTILRFSRKLNLCGDEDSYIKDDTVRLIWAFNGVDPTPGGSLQYHQSNRGNKNLYLLNPQRAVPPLPANVIYEEFLNPKVAVPTASTTYWCQSFRIPQLDRKHHVIKVEPIIQPGHESEVHHILLYACNHEISGDSFNMGHECYHPNMPQDFRGCTSTILSWAVGDGPLYLPENVGIPFGYDGDPNMLLLETHYDNPMGKQGLIDSSGFRITLTPDLRQHDAGILDIGEIVGPTQVIPPFSENFRTSGHCYPECLSQAMEPEGIKVFGSMLHSHLLGHALRIRHFRYGVEQPLIAEDNHYDFNYQYTRVMDKEVEVRPGDHMIMECDYRTTNSTEVTSGGLSTRNEMCLGFLMYYPKIKLGSCHSTPAPQYVATFLDVSIKPTTEITAPEKYAGKYLYNVLSTEVDWSDKNTRDRYQQLITQEDVDGFYVSCSDGSFTYPINGKVRSLPKQLITLPKVQTCGGFRAHLTTLSLFVSVFAALLV